MDEDRKPPPHGENEHDMMDGKHEEGLCKTENNVEAKLAPPLPTSASVSEFATLAYLSDDGEERMTEAKQENLTARQGSEDVEEEEAAAAMRRDKIEMDGYDCAAIRQLSLSFQEAILNGDVTKNQAQSPQHRAHEDSADDNYSHRERHVESPQSIEEDADRTLEPNYPGFNAFVPDEAINAVGVTVVLSEEEQAKQERAKQRRYIVWGLCIFVLFIILVVITAIFVSMDQSPMPALAVVPSMSPSQAPSFRPTSSRLEVAIETFAGYSGSEAFQNRSSPQFLAAEWIADADELDIPINSARALQRYALAVFYFALGGDGWFQCDRVDANCGDDPDDNHWLLDGVHECTWVGVQCSGGDFGTVQHIFFLRPGGYGLVGTLPSELTLLTDILAIAASHNQVTGTIPTFLGDMPKLTALRFSECGFEGTLPTEIFQELSLLGTIHFASNRLTGTLPTMLGEMTLRELDLSSNLLTGGIPTEVGTIREMTDMRLSGNSLTGTIPSELSQVTSLKSLHLTNNRLTGSIPTMIGDLRALQDFRAGENALTGPVPTEIYGLSEMVDFRADRNSITGEIVDLVENWNGTVRRIHLFENNMSGPLPIDAIHSLTNLHNLLLHGNRFTGTITAQICREKGSKFFELQNLTVPPTVECSIERFCCDLVA